MNYIEFIRTNLNNLIQYKKERKREFIRCSMFQCIQYSPELASSAYTQSATEIYVN